MVSEKSLQQVSIDIPVLAELGCSNEAGMLALAPSIDIIIASFHWCNYFLFKDVTLLVVQGIGIVISLQLYKYTSIFVLIKGCKRTFLK